MADEAWGPEHGGIEFRSRWPRIDEGCIGEIKRAASNGFSVIFLGAFGSILPPLGAWVEEHHQMPKSESGKGGEPVHVGRSYEYFIRQMETDAINQLRDTAVQCEVAILLTGSLTTGKKLKETHGLHQCDGQIHLYDDLTLRTIGRDWIGSGEWALEWDGPQQQSLRPSQETIRRHRQLPLNDNDHRILAVLRESGPMTPLEVSRRTSISRTTVIQRLEGLADERKGRLVENTGGGRWKAR